MTRKLVGFCGYARSGKDTAGAALASYGFKRIAMADPLKQSAVDVDPYVKTGDTFMRLSQLVDEVGWEEAKRNEDVRRFLQRLGTEGGRRVHGEDCWRNIAEEQILEELRWGTGAYVPDIRFPNEVDMIHSIGGILIHVTRPGVDAPNGHSSERLDSSYADAIIHNSSTEEELQKNVIVICKRLGVL